MVPGPSLVEASTRAGLENNTDLVASVASNVGVGDDAMRAGTTVGLGGARSLANVDGVLEVEDVSEGCCSCFEGLLDCF